MELKEAVVEFEKAFASVEPAKAFPVEQIAGLTYVYSGGTCAEGEPVPILYLNKEQAVDAWLSTARQHAGKATKLRWVVLPELVKFQITMADLKQRHRVVNDRWVVRSKFVGE